MSRVAVADNVPTLLVPVTIKARRANDPIGTYPQVGVLHKVIHKADRLLVKVTSFQ
jgi:hypothetical protein